MEEPEVPTEHLQEQIHHQAAHANCTMATDGTNAIAFFGSEGLYCYDLDGHLRWKNDLGVLRASPSVYNDVLDTNGWSLEWGFASSPVNRMEEVCMATPAISDRVLFYRTQDHVFAIGNRQE
jgi:hypothetical protein